MKVLFDENLAPRLVTDIADLFADSLHVRDVGLARASDPDIWSYARPHGLVIVSKDTDFLHLSFVHGHPPKVVWIKAGNCSTRGVERLVREKHEAILAFNADESGSFLILS